MLSPLDKEALVFYFCNWLMLVGLLVLFLFGTVWGVYIAAAGFVLQVLNLLHSVLSSLLLPDGG